MTEAAGHIAVGERRQGWATPFGVVELLHRFWRGPPDLDPCSNDASIVRAARNVRFPEDGLALDWRLFGSAFVNPPFNVCCRRCFKPKSSKRAEDRCACAEPLWGDLGDWMRKCATEPAEAIGLVPATVETRVWQDVIWRAPAVCFPRGRLTFIGAEHPCTFPVALPYWGMRPERFAAVFGEFGRVIHPSNAAQEQLEGVG